VCKDEATLALLETGESLRERYRRQAQLAAPSFLLTALNLANDCDINFKLARHKRLHVEMSLIKMGYIGRAVKAAQTPALEKKTPDGTLSPQNGQGNTPQSPTSNPKASNAQPLDKDRMSALETELNLGLKKADKISLNLASFEAAVEVEEAKKAAMESKLSLETATHEWKAYANVLESNLVKMAFMATRLELRDKMVVAHVKSTIDRSHVQGELMRVMDTLRNRLHDPHIKVQVLIDETLVMENTQQQVKKPATTRDKLDLMKEQNPFVADLLQRLELKLED
jgi:DNA polymerase-3 subunit gamma/tau